MLNAVTTKVRLPENNIAVRKYLENKAAKKKTTVELSLNRLADEIKTSNPNDTTNIKMVNAGSMLRVTGNDQNMIAEEMSKRGISQTDLLKLAVAEVSANALIEPIFNNEDVITDKDVIKDKNLILSCTAILPENEVPVEEFLKHESTLLGQTVEQFLKENVADKMKDKPPTANEIDKNIHNASVLRVNENTQEMLFGEMMKNGITEEKSIQAVIGAIAGKAFSHLIFN